MIRKIKRKERVKAGNIYCSYCRPKKVAAIYRIAGLGADHKTDFACEFHKDRLDRIDDKGYLTEADYQTWMRI